VLFDGSASADPDGGLLRYAWDFGDDTRSELVNPSKIFERPGVYEASLTVRDESGARTGSHTDRAAVVVHQAPTAVAGQPIRACTNQTVQFDGSASTESYGAVNLFQWNFGDGSTGGGERPTKVYDRPGEYRVVLTITGDALGSCSAVHSDEILVTIVDAPRLEIEGPGRVATGTPARWRAALTGPTASDDARFEWSFGAGATAEGREVEHAFPEAGLQVVSLRATLPESGEGCDVVETRLNVTVNAPPAPAIVGPERIAAGDQVLFDASGTVDPDGAITRFAWDFGDGARASGVQARHRYTTPGAFELRLIVTDDAGVANSRVVETRAITVTPAPVAGLKVAGQLCPGVAHPWSAPAGDGVATLWDFGRGDDPATAEKIEHVFAAPGIYPVTVTLDDGQGLANSRRTEEVFVRVNRPPVPAAGPDRLVCPGDIVAFDGAGSSDLDGDITAWRWDFDDGAGLDGARVERAFATPRTLEARLTVTDDSGSLCAASTDTARVRVNATPLPDAGPAREVMVGAAHDTVIFDAGGSLDPDGDGMMFRWDFGDGASASGAVVRHRYTEPGEFVVRLEARDATGLACGVATSETLVRAVARE
jgi:PKD repeat protein